MDSDDDFVTFSQPTEPSPEVMSKRLKRLKKSGSSRDSLPEVFGDPVLFTHVDFAKIEAMENDSERPFSEDSNSSEEKTLSDDPFSQDTDGENEDRNLFDGKDGRKAKRALDFSDGDMTAAIHAEGKSVGLNCEDLVEEKIKNPIGGVDDCLKGTELSEKKKQKVLLSDMPDVSKRLQRQRKTQLKELHAETQRILRETRDATFKPAPVVQKPISAILEKIRKRKFELSMKGDSNNGNCTSTNSLPDLHVSAEVREKENVKIVSSFVDEDGITDSGSRPCAETVYENEHTQETFDCTEPNGVAVEPSDEQPNSIKEDSALSLLNSNMEFDSASVDDDSSSEEDYNDKENIEPPSPPRVPRDSTFSASTDPVKDFIDEEAEEESDSENELGYISGNDDGDEEDIEDADDEGLHDIIATEYKEKPVDNEKRNELHQKWLEQQDAIGTDNLLQKLRCRSVVEDASFMMHENKKHEESDEDDETEEDSDDENLPSKPGHINTRKAKEIILQMYSEKDDAYLSEGDDDDMERWKLTSHRRQENEAAALASPNGNESAREVLGRIKNLNIVSGNKKKKPKELSFFESTLSGRNMCSSSKSSFIGRVSNHLVSSSSAKHGPRKARSFIFGMDDGNNSRSSSILTAEDSSDVVAEGSGLKRHHPTAKYSSSSSSQTGLVMAEKPSDISLLAVLKESSIKSSSSCGKDSSLALTKSIFGFTVPKTQ